MKKPLYLPLLLATLALGFSGLLSSCAASVQPAVVVRPRPLYRPYYRPAPVVVVAPRPVIVVAPRPVVAPLRPVRLAPAPRGYYNYRPHRFYGRLR